MYNRAFNCLCWSCDRSLGDTRRLLATHVIYHSFNPYPNHYLQATNVHFSCHFCADVKGEGGGDCSLQNKKTLHCFCLAFESGRKRKYRCLHLTCFCLSQKAFSSSWIQGGLQMQPNEKNDLIYDQVHISFTIIIALNWIIPLPVIHVANMATKQKKTPIA